jgi:hypothetical protein
VWIKNLTFAVSLATFKNAFGVMEYQENYAEGEILSQVVRNNSENLKVVCWSWGLMKNQLCNLKHHLNPAYCSLTKVFNVCFNVNPISPAYFFSWVIIKLNLFQLQLQLPAGTQLGNIKA